MGYRTTRRQLKALASYRARDDLDDALELAAVGGGHDGYRTSPGSGGIWLGRNDGIADANFQDWGLARATAIILNAAIKGELVRKR